MNGPLYACVVVIRANEVSQPPGDSDEDGAVFVTFDRVNSLPKGLREKDPG